MVHIFHRFCEPQNCNKGSDYTRNPQLIVDIVDNFIQNMWKFVFLHLYKQVIHQIVDKSVNGYIQNPHWYFKTFHILSETFSTTFRRDIHKLPTNCGYLVYNVDFIPFLVDRVWADFFRPDSFDFA